MDMGDKNARASGNKTLTAGLNRLANNTDR
jgi:hypothetical protein